MDWHAPTLARLRTAGSDPAPFKPHRRWVLPSLLALVLTAILPVQFPETLPVVSRTTPLLALFFLLAAVGHWFRLGARSFAISAVLVLVAYGASAWAPLAFELSDITFVAVLASFGVFALAGFNVVFIVEEIVADVHRNIHFRHRFWSYAPSLLILAIAIALPIWSHNGGPRWPTLWIASLAATAIMGGWWFFRAFNPIREGPILRELHLLVVGGLAIAAMLDAVGKMDTAGFLPSVLAYVALVGTWMYVSYTTLQRAHFLLNAARPTPWLLVLFGASFGLLQHAHFHFALEGTPGVTLLLRQRILYLIAGMVIGWVFYLMYGAWKLTQTIRDDRRMSPRGRILAGRLARLAEGFFATERRLESAAGRAYREVDKMLSWELEPSGELRRRDEEE